MDRFLLLDAESIASTALRCTASTAVDRTSFAATFVLLDSKSDSYLPMAAQDRRESRLTCVVVPGISHNVAAMYRACRALHGYCCKSWSHALRHEDFTDEVK